MIYYQPFSRYKNLYIPTEDFFWKIHGRITKVACEPYHHVIKETGEVVKFSHRWVFTPGEAAADEMVLDEKQVVNPDGFAF